MTDTEQPHLEMHLTLGVDKHRKIEKAIYIKERMQSLTLDTA